MLKRTYKKSFFCKRIGGYEQKRHTKAIALQLKRYVCKDVILSMALNQTNKLVWIVETIYQAHKISFEELNHRWMNNVDLSGGEEMSKRTFHKWKWNIFDTFGLSIECEKVAPYRYYIANVDDMKSDSIQKWLLSTLSVSNSLLENKSIKDRIILELP